MREFTLDDLKRIMHESGGIESQVDLNGETADTAFADLNCDSLAVLEIVARIGQEYVHLPDDAVLLLGSPRDAINVVNELLAGAA